MHSNGIVHDLSGQHHFVPKLHQTGQVLAAALDYMRRGWSIIPIAGGTKKPPKGFPWTPFRKRLPTESELSTWFDYREDLALAVILGQASGGLVCRDFDDKESYAQWTRAHRDLGKRLPTVKTSTGFHVYFRVAPNYLLFRDLRPAELGEYRGDDKHYCLLPPSLHPNGSCYKWLVPLPAGEVGYVEDPIAAGLLTDTHVTQKTQGNLRKSQVVNRGSRADVKRRRLSTEARAIIDDAIRRTIPTGPGNRRRMIMTLARMLKFHPEFAGIPSTDIDFLRPYVKQWWKLAQPYTSGKHPYFHQSWQDFVFAWEEARVPFGATMQAFWDEARAQPPPIVAVEKYGERSLRTLLASLCQVLQRHSPDKPFPLSVRLAGSLLGVSEIQASRWLKTLVADGIISAEKTYLRGYRLSNEYRFRGPLQFKDGGGTQTQSV
jgi:hypothetical protein